MASKQMQRPRDQNEYDYVMYHINNRLPRSRHTGPLVKWKCDSFDEPLPLSRKMQNMRHVLRKFQDIEKVNMIKNSKPTLTLSTASTQSQINSFIVNGCVQSNRMMVTSSIFSNKGKIHKIRATSGQLKKLSNIDRQFSCMQHFMKQRDKIIQFFSKTITSTKNKNNPFDCNRFRSLHRSAQIPTDRTTAISPQNINTTSVQLCTR